MQLSFIALAATLATIASASVDFTIVKTNEQSGGNWGVAHLFEFNNNVLVHYNDDTDPNHPDAIDYQKWHVTDHDGGSQIRNLLSGNCIDAYAKGDGTYGVHMFGCDVTNQNQWWNVHQHLESANPIQHAVFGNQCLNSASDNYGTVMGPCIDLGENDAGTNHNPRFNDDWYFAAL
ncbi:hypothetical protein HDU98_011577 [Podochytrium sp. JEL0797]|nr:hypothetical protein HDU98_011577 [Podochytrium sp. JEL0797]